MKILHVINNLGSGGAEKLLESSLPLLNKDEKIQVEILLLTRNNNVFEDTLIEANIKIFNLDSRIRDPMNIIRINKFINKGNYDIIHTHLFPSFYWVSIIKKFSKNKKIKFVHTEHSTYNKRRKFKISSHIEKYVYNSFDKIICITDETKKNLMGWLDIKEKDYSKFITIENGIDLKKFNNALAYSKNHLVPNLVKNDKIICMIGRFSQQKDQSTLIKSLSFLPKNYHLLLIGEGKNKAQLKELSKSNNVENRTHFLGFRNDIERILKTSDLVVLSSNWEGFGLAAIEGMAAGKPVLVSDVDGLLNVVGNAGFSFSRGNHKNLAEKILEISKLNIHDIEFNAVEHSKNFSIEKMSRKYKELYYSIKGD